MHFYRCYSICIINVCVGHIVDIETTATVSLSIDKRDSVGIIHGIITFF